MKYIRLTDTYFRIFIKRVDYNKLLNDPKPPRHTYNNKVFHFPNCQKNENAFIKFKDRVGIYTECVKYIRTVYVIYISYMVDIPVIE